MNPNLLKGKIIIKRTSLIHAYKRSFKRDVEKKIELYKKRKIKLSDVFNKFYERVKLPINDYIEINKFINRVLKMDRKTIE